MSGRGSANGSGLTRTRMGHVAPRQAREGMLARLRQEQRSLHELLEAMGSELELPELLTRILRSACELLDANHGTIGLVDEERHVVRTEAAHNMPPGEIGAEMQVGEGIAGEVLRTRAPVILRRYGDLEHPVRVEMLDHTVLGMPIKWRGAMIGFFGIGRSVHKDLGAEAAPFTPRDRAALETFARYAAIAIHLARGYRLERLRAERLAIINRVGRIITADLRLDELLQTAADTLHELMGYPNIAIPLLERGDPDVLVIEALGGMYRRLVETGYRLPVTQGLMGVAVRTRQPVLVNDVERDPRYVRAPKVKGIYAELAIPILLGDECLGVLNVESERALTRDDAEHLRFVADQLAVAIDNARLHAATRDVAVVEERHRLARDLHDSVTQLLFSVTLVAQSLAPAWRRGAEEGERRTERVLELSHYALVEMRSLLSELRSAQDATSRMRRKEGARGIDVVRRQGLVEAMRRHVTSLSSDALSIVIEASTYRGAADDVEDALFRITQEALFNVVKHANAREARVELSQTMSKVRLRISDDGVGMPRVQPMRSTTGGFGLVFMHERAEGLGGTLRVGRGKGKGTMIEANIPKGGAPQR